MISPHACLFRFSGHHLQFLYRYKRDVMMYDYQALVGRTSIPPKDQLNKISFKCRTRIDLARDWLVTVMI